MVCVNLWGDAMTVAPTTDRYKTIVRARKYSALSKGGFRLPLDDAVMHSGFQGQPHFFDFFMAPSCQALTPPQDPMRFILI